LTDQLEDEEDHDELGLFVSIRVSATSDDEYDNIPARLFTRLRKMDFPLIFRYKRLLCFANTASLFHSFNQLLEKVVAAIFLPIFPKNLLIPKSFKLLYNRIRV